MSKATKSQDAQPPWRLSRRQTLALLAMLVINLVVYAGLWLLNQGGRSTTLPTTLVAGETLSLEMAYRQALGRAHQWQPDAQLASVTTSWQVASGERLMLQQSDWAFQFYSPQASRIHVVNVDVTGAYAGPQQSVKIAPVQVVPDWSVDSDELLLTFMSYGGNEFIGAHPRANVHLQLKAGEDARPKWYVTGVDPVLRTAHTVSVDARTRQVITTAVD